LRLNGQLQTNAVIICSDSEIKPDELISTKTQNMTTKQQKPLFFQGLLQIGGWRQYNKSHNIFNTLQKFVTFYKGDSKYTS